MFSIFSQAIILSLCAVCSMCATHWMVTDDGLMIQSVSDSPFNMAQPHSLVQFLDQERRLDEISKSRGFFEEHEKSIRVQESSDDPNLEAHLRSTDADCIAANSLNDNKDPFLVSYPLLDSIKDFDYLVNMITTISQDGVKEVPFCSTDLPFSMYAFEHLPSMQQRASLSVSFEYDLHKSLPPRFRLVDLGHYVALAFRTEPTSPALLNMAALYWRIRGEPLNAVECLRRSLHYSSKGNRWRAMFSLANLVHIAGFSGDAVILYQLALTEVDDPVIHVALGDALALTQNRTEAIEEFEKAFARDSKLTDASLKASILKCDMKLLAAMEQQHQTLLDTISQKTMFTRRFDLVKSMEEGVRKNVADVEARLQSSLIYDHFVYGNLPHVSCRTVVEAERMGMKCAVSDWRRYRAAVDEKHAKMVAAARKNAPNLDNATMRYSFDDEEEISPELAAFLEALAPLRGMDMNEPIARPLYPRKVEGTASKLLERYLSDGWPNRTQCEANKWKYPLPSSNTLPQLFMSPDTKGYSVSDLLGKYLGLSPLQEHPLPWSAPLCGSFVVDPTTSAIFMLGGVQWAASRGRSTKLADDKLRPTFLRLVSGKAAEADIAQRINTLMHYEIGPRWLVFNLAALYWRVTGVPGEAITCLRAALQAQPERHADVALTQLAQIVIRSAVKEEHLSDAAALLNTAIHVDPNEPLTHFLNGIVKLLQKRRAAATAHIRAALILDPSFQPAVAVLHALKCSSKSKSELAGERMHLRCCSPSEPNVFCIGSMVGGCFTVHNRRSFEASQCGPSERLHKKNVCRRAVSLAPLVAPAASHARDGNKKRYESRSTMTSRQSFSPDAEEENSFDEIALDFGGEQSLKKIRDELTSPPSWMSQQEVRYLRNVFLREVIYPGVGGQLSQDREEEWEEEVSITIAPFPELPLSMSHITERRQMLVFDISLPDILPLPMKDQVKKGLRYLSPTKLSESNFCSNVKMSLSMLQEQPTSTWVSVSAKGVDFEQYMDLTTTVPAIAGFEPVCPDLDRPSPLRTLDHLPAYHLRDQFIFYKPEKALTDAFLSLGNEKERVEHVAGRLMIAMKVSKLTPNLKNGQDGGVHWTLSTASTLYWRVKGDAVNAIKCLRHSLNNAPPDMNDVALVSMANIYQQAGLLHSALIAGGAALMISPKLVAIHFTLANIYASMGEYQYALQFYYSTLSLQSNFEPAKERIRAIFCQTGKTFEFQTHTANFR